MLLKMLAAVPRIGTTFSKEPARRPQDTTSNLVIVSTPAVEVTHLDVVAMISAAAREIDEARRAVRSQGALTHLDHAWDMLREVEVFFTE